MDRGTRCKDTEMRMLQHLTHPPQQQISSRVLRRCRGLERRLCWNCCRTSGWNTGLVTAPLLLFCITTYTLCPKAKVVPTGIHRRWILS
ncbi:hypothetical protein I79_016564 [Cricetulus griseus]|uniref:Uncharacterized protein n=1 Tax=Cricetulus griseus TaxID=10029 RepID=G3HZQ6_CRIGR|nr:hypothetical protein I79_016564 [Cricetulus griseus]